MLIVIETKLKSLSFFGADDNNITASKLLSQNGGVRLQPSPKLKHFSNVISKYDTHLGHLPYILADIYILAGAAEFLGNPLSSFSGLICSLRVAHGRRCINMPPNFYVDQCIGYPDTKNLFLQFRNTYARRSGFTFNPRGNWSMTPCELVAYKNTSTPILGSGLVKAFRIKNEDT
eukprot:NODE_6385_length_890_cov_60.069100_g5793_i0.p1 GENE.NODE_6385_length_890_cov_60.069100_g5793_i0~~NODE_6385_length_890_cov_60.069100_g5793_i0.p1  ORF type:complete len:175 (-),score=25.36 NODE_6385_length_890_cov_60.069100_g5793_i0:67-591(-)